MSETVLQEFMNRFPEVEVDLHPRFHPELIDGVRTYSLDVALVLSPFKSVDPPPRYMQLGTFELVAVVPEGHRLAELERLPRSELLTEAFLDWPRNMNPEMVDHIHRVLFGELEHPQVVEIPDLEEARRFEHVASGRGIAISVRPPGPQRHTSGVALRHFEEPPPLISYGVAWASTQSSPLVDAFLEIARGFASSEAPSHPD